ncbi:MAG: MupG family TIM beta-alpha barrel fold protein [Elusimicrobiota bacterium]|jgi:hypothetical protein|nr:MupG family TIM beta-alpha barrel fold protein [Elusimicrobiota bacterium]
MIFSIYPTDEKSVQTTVLENAERQKSDLLFTSLHIPESKGLMDYLDFLKNLHKEKGFSFFADISPLAFERLNLKIEEAQKLGEFGIEGLRIDFGFNIEQMKQIAKSGLKIAINASTVSEQTIKNLSKFNLIGWHNYYPRPETGLCEEFFISQNALFEKYEIPLYAFIPGENHFRAPLHLGLPTLENQRNKNACLNFLELALKYPKIKIVCAEGGLYQKHLNWISDYENNDIITLALSYADEKIFETLNDKVFNVRIEKTDFSWRLENTRSKIVPSKFDCAKNRSKGSLQMDTEKFGRYQGEIHIIRKDLQPNEWTTHIADISKPYRDILDFPLGGKKIKFVKESL